LLIVGVGGGVGVAAAQVAISRGIRVIGTAKYGGVSVQRDATGSTLRALATLVEQGSFKSMVSQILPSEEAARALEAVERGHATGKVVIEIEGRGR
jgi:hypothetical protein